MSCIVDLISGMIACMIAQSNLYISNMHVHTFVSDFFSHRNGKLMDNHRGDLGRIVRSKPINEDGSEDEQNGHSFLYDLELVLGGKLNAVARYELLYTTAFEEGMIGDSRRQRKRKPTQLQEETASVEPAGKNSAAVKKKKKAPANSKSNAKSSSSKTMATKGTNNKKRGSKTSANTNGKKKSKSAAAKASENVTIVNASNASNGLGMFERHRREFERSLLRLQKMDVYNFFSEEDVPAEHDECYEPKATAVSQENATTTIGETEQNTSISTQESTNPSTAPDNVMSLSTKIENDKEKENVPITFPSHPPYNFVVLRKRLEQGRYLLDRQRLSDNEENFASDGTKIKADNDDKSHKSTKITMEHPVGIHWDLFRDDIMGMCHSAIARNEGNFDDGTPGTLSNTAEKIKTTMEQIYEKTGKKQSKEMEVSNDAHRFTKIIEGAENKEAALQGKAWRRKGESFYHRFGIGMWINHFRSSINILPTCLLSNHLYSLSGETV